MADCQLVVWYRICLKDKHRQSSGKHSVLRHLNVPLRCSHIRQGYAFTMETDLVNAKRPGPMPGEVSLGEGRSGGYDWELHYWPEFPNHRVVALRIGVAVEHTSLPGALTVRLVP